jgi:hypothetical protein
LNNWPKIVIPTLVVSILGSIYLMFVWHGRQDPGVTQHSRYQDVSKDELVIMKAYFPRYFEDTERIAGTTVWMKNGYVISYFVYSNDRVDFTKRVGLVPSDQRLDVKKIVKAALPVGQYDGMTSGKQQAFAIFSTPGSEGLYAVPIGFMNGDDEAYYSDALFFYDDPHTIYDYWPKDVWTAIDAHQVKTGMSELQTRLAVGQKMDLRGHEEGERTVIFDQAGKHWTVRFQNKQAVSVQSDNGTVAKGE